ncbi:DUF4269 domain-containing protein [Bacillus horti]|uniref:DUF4269 domain-containing protein n=1 Tax=Caldalkalibacillus horti TaxID=77523 RepID=A0ABT9VYE8_9BACI|nr:DUF4269 domain-containing protein [Bacillus horti]MDQ0166015.1 hypothetical protein [Bacillus horti]
MITSSQDFTQIDYLAKGNERQKDAYKTLRSMRLMELLEKFDPLLVGTIPIQIDLPESDLDIICEVHDFEHFEKHCVSHFQQYDDFVCSRSTVNGIKRIVVNFTHLGWPFEIFGQSLPTVQQNGYRHMVIEYRILQLMGSKGLKYIRELKAAGFKTEPAFAKLLGLVGDPYMALLQLYDWNDDKLKFLINKAN